MHTLLDPQPQYPDPELVERVRESYLQSFANVFDLELHVLSDAAATHTLTELVQKYPDIAKLELKRGV